MSFQGDVRGIGLAELLQGLARGRKEGTLTLTAKGGGRSVLGLEDGKAWMLPDPDEDPDVWRDRVRSAFAEDPNFTMDAGRLSQVAKAARLEVLYSLLDGGGVHFRFDPGELPARTTRLQEEGAQDTEIHCDPLPVEFLLLEYARIADELEGAGPSAAVDADEIPCVQDPSQLGSVPPSFVQEINGNSTIQEIADRLGWPLRQARLAVGPAISASGLRFAHPIEILHLALYELQQKNFTRAGVRLALWAREGTPGPLVAEDAEALSNEWLAGRLTAALRTMPMKALRTLLRRLDHSLGSAASSVVHWAEANRIDKLDRVVRLRFHAAQMRDAASTNEMPTDPEALPEVRDLLDLARDLRDEGHPWRSGPALAMAAHLQPQGVAQRLELGLGLVQAGRAEDAGPWVVTACGEILGQGHADRTLSPLRQLLEADPRNRDARQLLARAKRASTRTKKLRRNVMVGFAIVTMAGGAAFVKVRKDRLRQERIQVVHGLLDDPVRGLAELDQHFADDGTAEVDDLRRELEERLRKAELQQRNAWLDAYHAVQLESQNGDPVKALGALRELPPPPRLRLVNEPWPDEADLAKGIVVRLTDDVLALGAPSAASPQQRATEERVGEQLDALRACMTDDERESEAYAEFRDGLDELEDLLRRRAEERAVIAQEREHRDRLEEGDRLLAAARRAAEQREFERALRHYDEILRDDPTGKVRQVLADEVAAVEQKQRAIIEARSLAADGLHDVAHGQLVAAFGDATSFMLPWSVASFPTGAEVTFSDGRVQRTPFQVEGTFADEWTLTFRLEGFDTHVVEVEGPQDVLVRLSRTVDRGYESEGLVEAIPAPVGNDHVVCDRRGGIARLGPDGELRWRSEIRTLSGIARAPVPMPGRAGELLLVTETGAAWIVDPEDGSLEGPWELGSPPMLGPASVGGEVHVQLRDGKVARWRTSLRPMIEDASAVAALPEEFRYGSQYGFAVLRSRGTPDEVLANPSNEWRAEVDDDVVLVYREGLRHEGFSLARRGEWSFVAWEPPRADAKLGRLWVADERGIRAVVPF